METLRTTCSLCRNGCQLGVVFDGYQYRMEYLTDVPPNNGRTCPRGNSASIVLDHPKRLAYPLLDGKEVSWSSAFELLRRWRTEVKPEEIAIVYSRGAGVSELGIVRGLAAALGTEKVVCGYIEPDNGFQYRLSGVKQATLEDLSAARATILVGDVFNTSPVAVKRILEARYAEKQSRLIVVDSIKTRQAGFAHLFIQTRPGTEYLIMAGIAGILDGKLKLDVDGIAQLTGVPRAQLEDAAKMLKPGIRGVVACAASMGRVGEPFWHSICAQLVALKAEKPFAGFGEALVPDGKLSFGRFWQALRAGEIKMVFWFGGLHPYSYPELLPELKQINFRVATSIFRPGEPLPGLVLPVPSEFERAGVGESLWGEVKFHPLAQPVSGTKSLLEIANHCLGQTGSVQEIPGEKFRTVRVDEVASRLGDMLNEHLTRRFTPPDGSLLLVGRKEAIGVGGFFDPEEEILMSPADVAKFGVKDGDRVAVKSKTAEREFRVKVSGTVREGLVSVGVNVHRNRALFPVEVDAGSGNVKIPPTEVEVWKVQA